ncbi:TonB-dependent receptor domain-containing protein [Pseudoalteromonas piscicida]|uniref:TonB-dependent receptor domain-containing protein n=1 Tax=Pseudoalteromonas piscicida TaxID=43662 RepID=UPI0030B5F39A
MNYSKLSIAVAASLFSMQATQTFASDVKQADQNIEVIVVEGEKLQLRKREIEHTKGSSNSDIFSTFTGVNANNLRNEAGALDIGIRGVQGEGRVPIFIDGSLQSTHTNRGYMGSADRTYIDSDLISDLSLEKGATSKGSAFSSGAIGGSVTIRTLNAQDVLKEGEQFGALVKLKTHNNNKMPEIAENFGLQSYYEVSNDNDTFDFDGGGITLATAYQSDRLQAVLAFSDKKVGNYFAGKHGFDNFVEVDEFTKYVPPTDAAGNALNVPWSEYIETTEIVHTPPPVNREGEVVNTSFESESYLAKFSYALNDEHSIEANTRLHRQEAGEMLASYWYKGRAGDLKYWTSVDENGEKQTHIEKIPEGVETMPQWEPGSATVNSASVLYRYLPASTSLIDLKINAWRTSAKLKQYNALGSNLGSNAGQYFHRYSNKRAGVGVLNTSSFTVASYPVTLLYGLSWQEETLAPHKDWLNNFKKDYFPDDHQYTPTSRHGKQVKRAIFTNAQIDLSPLELSLNINHHDSENQDHQTGEQLRFDGKTDITVQGVYYVVDNTAIKAKFSNAYRMPNLYESTISNEVFSYSPDYPVGPEKTQSYDIGIESDFSNVLTNGDKLVVFAEYFNTHIKDMLATGFLPSKKPDAESWDQNFTFTNYDKFELPGAEFGLNYQGDLFYGKIAYTKYFDVEMCSSLVAEAEGVDTCNATGFSGSLTPVRIPPKKHLIANIGTTLFNDKADIGLTYKGHSEKMHPAGFLSGTGANALQRIPAGYQLDFYADYKFNESYSAFLTVSNLTNRYTVSSGSVVAMPEPGRTVTFGVEIKL